MPSDICAHKHRVRFDNCRIYFEHIRAKTKKKKNILFKHRSISSMTSHKSVTSKRTNYYETESKRQFKNLLNTQKDVCCFFLYSIFILLRKYNMHDTVVKTTTLSRCSKKEIAFCMSIYLCVWLIKPFSRDGCEIKKNKIEKLFI